jgi:hypothetical protein
VAISRTCQLALPTGVTEFRRVASITKQGEVILNLLQKQSLHPSEVETLFQIAIHTIYTEVIIFLHEQKKEYMECMMRFIHDSEVSAKVFDWITRLIPDVPEVKRLAMKFLDKLIKIDVDRTVELIHEWLD